eukprot:1157757-Pelagomonas_calceolata.AAC.9
MERKGYIAVPSYEGSLALQEKGHQSACMTARLRGSWCCQACRVGHVHTPCLFAMYTHRVNTPCIPHFPCKFVEKYSMCIRHCSNPTDMVCPRSTLAFQQGGGSTARPTQPNPMQIIAGPGHQLIIANPGFLSLLCSQSGNYKAPKQIITDPEELAEYRLRTRKHFEDTVRRIGRFQHAIWNKVGDGDALNGGDSGDSGDALEVCTRAAALCVCLQYAIWEEQQKDFRRARSVFERALDVTYTNPSLWTKVCAFVCVGCVCVCKRSSSHLRAIACSVCIPMHCACSLGQPYLYGLCTCGQRQLNGRCGDAPVPEASA